MHGVRFPLSSEELEILSAFEYYKNINALSSALAKDSSVVSKKIKKLAEKVPVIEKVSGRWQITPIGRSINSLTRKFAIDLNASLPSSENLIQVLNKEFIGNKLALILVNVQKSFLDPIWGMSSTPHAQSTIIKILNKWRTTGNPIVYVKHTTEDRNHPFYINSEGCKIMEGLEPNKDDLVVHKSSASAFNDTNLGIDFTEMGINSIVLVGFTASECIDATAKQAKDLGFKSFVISDATATFQMPTNIDKKYTAHAIHDFTMTRLNKVFAEVIESEALFKYLK